MESPGIIRLTRHDGPGGAVSIRVDGRLDRQTVAALEAALPAGPAAAGLTLDLSGVAWLDREGRAALLRVRARGGRLVGGSLYVTGLLQENAE
jgi:anti-anti-sigma regulatory factor